MFENITENEKDLIKQFWQNEALRKAVRKLMFSTILDQTDPSKPSHHWVFNLYGQDLSDDELGAKVKLQAEASKKLESCFWAMEKIGEEKPKEEVKVINNMK